MSAWKLLRSRRPLGRNRHVGRPLAVVVLATSLATALACTTFTSSDPESVTADGGAPLDSALLDGASTDSDASDASERFCAGHVDAAFCADFDDGALGVPPFSEVVNAALDSRTFASAPASLRAAAMGDGGSFVRKTDFDDSAFEHVQRLSFDTHPGAPDGGDVAADAKLFRLDQDVTGCKIEFETLGRQVKLNVFEPGDAGDYEEYNLPPDVLSGGKWHHVELLLEVTNAGVVAKLTIDGKPSLASARIACAKLAAKPDLLMGLFGVTEFGQALNGTAYFDNVLFESR